MLRSKGVITLEQWLEFALSVLKLKYPGKFYRDLFKSFKKQLSNSKKYSEEVSKVQRVLKRAFTSSTFSSNSKDGDNLALEKTIGDLEAILDSIKEGDVKKSPVSQGGVKSGNRNLYSGAPGQLQKNKSGVVFYVSAFSLHGYISSPKKQLFCFGWNKHYQLGLGDKNNRRFPVVHEPLSTKVVKKMACGRKHSLALGSKNVFSSGDCGFGQTGQGIEKRRKYIQTMATIDSLKGVKVVDVACGFSTSFFITEEGKVLGCGEGHTGLLGTGRRQNESVPREVVLPAEVRVKKVVSSGTHTLFLALSGSVFGTGCSRCGMFSTRLPMKYKGKGLENDNVVDIRCGQKFSCFLLDDARLLLCGELGEEIREKKPTPFWKNVARFATGWDSIIVETSDGLFSCGALFDDSNSLKLINRFSRAPIDAIYSTSYDCFFVTSDQRIWGTVQQQTKGKGGSREGGGEDGTLFSEHQDVVDETNRKISCLLPIQRYIGMWDGFVRKYFPKSGYSLLNPANIRSGIMEEIAKLERVRLKITPYCEFFSDFCSAKKIDPERQFSLATVQIQKRGRGLLKTKITFVTYFGETKAELRDGLGMEYDEETGSLKYFGEFKQGKRHGRGRVFKNEKVTKKGRWVNGVYSLKEINYSLRIEKNMSVEMNLLLTREKKILEKKLKEAEDKVEDMIRAKDEEIKEKSATIQNLILKNQRIEQEKVLLNFERVLRGTSLSDYKIYFQLSSTETVDGVYQVQILGEEFILRVDFDEDLEKNCNLVPLHPNAVRVHCVFQDSLKKMKFGSSILPNKKATFVVMPSLSTNLAGVIEKRGGKYPIFGDEEFFEFLHQMIKVLLAFKSSSLVHRNIKPSNIYLSGSEKAPIFQLGDYRYLLRSNPLFQFAYLFPGMTAGGCKKYMPSEVKNQQKFGPCEFISMDKYDIYSLGVVCYELYANWDHDDDETYNNGELNVSACENDSIRDLIRRMLSPSYAKRICLEKLDALCKENME